MLTRLWPSLTATSLRARPWPLRRPSESGPVPPLPVDTLDPPRPDGAAEAEADSATTGTLETDTTTDDLLPLDTTTDDTRRTTTGDLLLRGTTTGTDSPALVPLEVAAAATEVIEVATAVAEADTTTETENDTLLLETTEALLLPETREICESPGTRTETEATVEVIDTADLLLGSGSSAVSTVVATTTDPRCVAHNLADLMTPQHRPTLRHATVCVSLFDYSAIRFFSTLALALLFLR